ncbi:MAG TPA: phage tail sheath subtilisin-like domain-containing protein [Methanothrix soehngenii]|nr:phage tail sheath subtilisin-like domain-containing protein [Methanothrix soehngenii]
MYIEEIPSGVRTITGVATSITAFVGYTARGALDSPIRIHNFGEFEREFGGLHRDSLVSYAVQQFFLNGGSDAYVVRVARGAQPASLMIKGLDTYHNKDVIKVSAKSPGTWGNDVRLDIDYATSNPDSTFNLTATRYEIRAGQLVAVETERHINLSMNSSSPKYAVDVIKTSSKMIQLERLCNLDNTSDRGWSLSGNLSGTITGLASGDVISGILNGDRYFELYLDTVPDNLADLISALNNSIYIVGLQDYLQAAAADAGGVVGAGNFLRITSLKLDSDDSTKAEFSSVEITSSPPSLKLGLANGGREKEGASHCRPAPSGTVSRDLSIELDKKTEISGIMGVMVRNRDSSQVKELLPTGTSITIEITEVGEDLRSQLETKISQIAEEATKSAVVQLSGSRLRIQSSADSPNISVEFSETLNANGGSTSLFGSDGYNLQQYRLGNGTIWGAQSSPDKGQDGQPPDGANILGEFGKKTGIYSLRDVDLFNLMVIPETIRLSSAEANSVIQSAVAFCEAQRAFFIIDPPSKKEHTAISAWAEGASKSRNAALFYPHIQIADPLSGFRLKDMPPSGAIAGIFARTDTQRGVWKAPAGIDAAINGALGLETLLTDLENGPINQMGVNCLRKFPVYGIVSWGARTRRGADGMADEYKYIPVRRLALFLEESLYRGLKWVVFEPNDEPLWSQIRLNVGAYMHNLFRQGAFQGKSPREAYFVKCDNETTTQTDINQGIVNILVGFAPLKPAEFVVIKIQQMAGQIQT